MTSTRTQNVTGMILAGGKARRLGGQDKGLVEIKGLPMIQYVVQSLEPQVQTIIINANRNISTYEKLGYPVISDQLADFQGPLAGIVVGLKNSNTDYLCTCPCDGPLIPEDLVSRLLGAMEKKHYEICVAHDGNRIQPVYCLLKQNLIHSLEQYLESGERKIDRWFTQHRCGEVDFSDKPECFMNVNTPQDQQEISGYLQT